MTNMPTISIIVLSCILAIASPTLFLYAMGGLICLILSPILIPLVLGIAGFFSPVLVFAAVIIGMGWFA